ncbi:CcdB family protein [Sphingomonas sp.]|uniref:CcdB family protein n=1 Tax=Sphingomonas sp. TaxID=28214 RepID=UPI00258BCE25|nr:CcdB family protein [Sphingomonas sp.]
MARLDVVRLKGGSIAIDCQADILRHMATRFTVPLLPLEQLPEVIAGLHPSFDVAGRRLIMASHLAGAVPARMIEEKVGSLHDMEYAVQRALDMLTGSY